MATPSLKVTPCQPFIGAEISGVDLTQPLAPHVANALRAASLEYQVIVLRNQNITRKQHIEFARLFARNSVQPFVIPEMQSKPIPGFPEILNVAADGVKKTAVDSWHTDESIRKVTPSVSILRAMVLPSFGGDTLFSSAVAAYQRLPGEIKARIRNLKALHGFQYSLKKSAGSLDMERARKFMAENPPVAHPVVRIHPETKKPLLYVSPHYTGEIVGMQQKEGEELLAYLFGEVTRPDYQMRVRWELGTIVVWDNRSVLHYAVHDYNEPRVMERVTVSGDAPVGFPDPPSNSFN
jgi:alpha-ketoglutarate-dependent taurine dioxygenase